MAETSVTTNGKSTSTGFYSTLRAKRARGVDGTGIAYEVVGEGPKTVMIANGLGGRLYAWSAVLDALYKEYRFVTWDYRGLFDSDSPESKRRLAVVHHVEDARSILDAEGIDRAVFMGWSMGVQVSLDMAASYPERVGGLVLLNGTYGHVLSTGFQPLFGVPGLPKRLHAICDFLQDHPELADKLAMVARTMQWPTAALMSITAGRNAFRMKPLLARYFDDVLGKSFVNYLRLFQELDAHSVYHLLREIHQPALVVSGFLDALTPAYQSKEIARRMPNAEYLRIFRSSHFSLMERPEIVVPRVRGFLETRAVF
jgi:pimeloyl-ACP methyl ester carboxylesterase